MKDQLQALYTLTYLLGNCGDYPCRCCGSMKAEQELTVALSKFRVLIDRSAGFLISSGYRCHRHNEAIGGHPNSHHTRGTAIDLIYPKKEDRDKFLPILKDVLKLPRIGLYEWGIHFDVEGPLPQRVWYG